MSDKLRNIGIMAHIDAGKTTTTERILFYTGVNHKIGEVHDGAATMDWMVQEQERGITITAAATKCKWQDYDINIIDTPGHVDFTVEVERSLRVLDGAVCVFDGVAGVEPQTETVWRQADKYKVPRICFVNKLDRVGASLSETVYQIENKFDVKPLVLFFPKYEDSELVGLYDILNLELIVFDEDSNGLEMKSLQLEGERKNELEVQRDNIIELIADFSDEIAELFLEGKSVGNEMINDWIRRLTIEMKIVPVVCGSAFKNKGVQQVLNAVCEYLPSPLDRGALKGSSIGKDEDIYREPTSKEKFSGMIFKIVNDSFVGNLAFCRVYSGSISVGDQVVNSNNNTKQRIQKIMQIHADKRVEIQTAVAGDIIAIAGLKEIQTGQTVCDAKFKIIYDKLEYPEPVISIAVEPKTSVDEKKLDNVLKAMTTEDPSLVIDKNQETGQILIKGMGELHLEIVVDRMKREHGVNVNIGKPQVSYRESIFEDFQMKSIFEYLDSDESKTIIGSYNIKKIEKEELKVLFSSKVLKNNNHLRLAFEDQFNQSAKGGFLAGYPLIGLELFVDNLIVDENISEINIRKFVNTIFKDIQNKPKLDKGILEPIMEVTIIVPADYSGDVIADINSKNGLIRSISPLMSDREEILVEMPLEGMFGYTTDLRSKTKGRGQFSMSFQEFRRVKKSKQDQIMKKLGLIFDF
jgi:elongation factor G